MLLKDYTSCSTAGIKQLDEQLINQVNTISPGLLTYFGGIPRISCGGGCHPYLQQPAVEAIKKTIQARPASQLKCNSAYRTVAQQFILYNHFCANPKRCGITAAATPGNSNHNSGLALDIEDYAGWQPYLESQGWDWLGSWDKWHFDFIGDKITRPKLRNIRKISILAFQQLWNMNRKLATPEYFKLDENGIWCQRTREALLYTPAEGFKYESKPIDKNIPSSQYNSSITNASIGKSASKPSLRKGDKGASVRELQALLIKTGGKLTADGDYGVATEKAVRVFQTANGLSADGVVGRQTWERLA